MLYDQQAVVAILQDGHELEDGEGPADLQLGEVAVQPAEDAGVVARDVKNLVSLQVKMTIQGFDQHLHRGDKDIEGLGEHGDDRVEFNFHDKEGWPWGYEGETRELGESNQNRPAMKRITS